MNENTTPKWEEEKSRQRWESEATRSLKQAEVPFKDQIRQVEAWEEYKGVSFFSGKRTQKLNRQRRRADQKDNRRGKKTKGQRFVQDLIRTIKSEANKVAKDQKIASNVKIKVIEEARKAVKKLENPEFDPKEGTKVLTDFRDSVKKSLKETKNAL